MIRYCDEYLADAALAASAVPNIEKLFGSTVLLTGATGLICSSVADILLQLNRTRNAGIKIVLAGRSPDRLAARFPIYREGEDYSFCRYDATENLKPDAAADYIIHAASNASPAVYVKEPVETMLANIVGLNSLLSAAKDMDCRRLLYVSSSEVYGKIPENRPYLEEDFGYVDILAPRSCYPSAKRAAETLCVSYAEEYGIETVMVRPGHIYGPAITPSDNRASAEFTRDAAEGRDIVMKSPGQQLRSYCYCMDCASAFLAVLLNGESGKAYNISNKDSVCTISDIAHALAGAAGRSVVFQDATALEKKGFNQMSCSALNAEKLEALGWQARFDLQTGAEKTLAYYQK